MTVDTSFGIMLGLIFGIGITILVVSLLRPIRQEPPNTSHEHVWDPWEKFEVEELTEPGKIWGAKIGRIVTQQRTCLACGYTDYQRETYTN